MVEKAKEAFFDELFELDKESEEEDSINASVTLRESKVSSPEHSRILKHPKARSIEPSGNGKEFGRNVSAPLFTSLATIAQQDKIPMTGSVSFDASDNDKKRRFSKAPGVTTEVTTKKNIQKINGKRKRSNSVDVKPASQQIFKNLEFFFFPNNSVSASRRLRIHKALEWGALWVREWRNGITHIIVDKDLCYKDLLIFLKVPSLPPSIVVVNEIYPADCIIYHFLVNPNQAQYRVNGYLDASFPQQLHTSIICRDDSLPLKPARKASKQQTISGSEGTDHDAPVQQDRAIYHENCGLPISSSPTDRAPENHPSKHIQDTGRHVTDDSSPEYHNLSSKGSIAVTSHYQDALTEAIEATKAVKDLPLNLDEDEVTKSFISADSSGDEDSEEVMKLKAKKAPSDTAWQQKFICMSKHDGKGTSENPNKRTIEVLEQMANYYSLTNDHWRTTAYRKAISALRRLDRKITTEAEALAIPSIGGRLAAKIEEIVWTNKLRRLDNTALEPNDQVLQLFMGIYGAGHAQATKWISQGYRTMEDLIQKAQLTKNQKIGIEHYKDFKSRIPREEMDRHDSYVRKTCNELDPNLRFIIGGSYRRGAPSSGDVDLIVTHPTCPIETLRTTIFETVIPHLFQTGYLKVTLATSSKDEGSKWHGAAALPRTSTWRRIDFLLVPWDEMGAALIYFTGNDIFNRSIRLLAAKKGMRLNQHGLWEDVIRGPNRARVTQGTLVEGRDERKIFEILGVPWRPPEHRIC